VSLVIIQEGPTWLTVGSANAVKQQEISSRDSMQSGLEA